MKKILIISLTILSLTTFGGTPERIGGYNVDSLTAKNILFIKSNSLIVLPRPGLELVDSTLWWYTGTRFINLSTGGGGGSSSDTTGVFKNQNGKIKPYNTLKSGKYYSPKNSYYPQWAIHSDSIQIYDGFFESFNIHADDNDEINIGAAGRPSFYIGYSLYNIGSLGQYNLQSGAINDINIGASGQYNLTIGQENINLGLHGQQNLHGNSSGNISIGNGNKSKWTESNMIRIDNHADTITTFIAGDMSADTLNINANLKLSKQNYSGPDSDRVAMTYGKAKTLFGVVNKISYTLVSADILSGATKEIIPAPGSGKYINLITVQLIYNYNTTTYATNASINITHGTTGSNWNSQAFLGSTSSVQYQIKPTGLGTTTDNNLNVNIATSSSNTTGNGSVEVYILYTIETY